MTLSDVNYMIYFADRQLKFRPLHFTIANTAATTESLYWVVTNLQGRYSLEHVSNGLIEIAFENPSDALHYELYWGK